MAPTTLIVLVVVRHEGRYLIVEERDGTFYFPAGKVEPGESLTTAALRETSEEAGVIIGLSGLLGFDHEWSAVSGSMRLRFVFVGFPAVVAPPKRRADHHSRGASWVLRDELSTLRLRDPEVITWIDRYERGPTLLPCDAYHPYGTDASSEGRL